MVPHMKRFAWKASLLAAVVSLLAFTVVLAASGDLDTTFGDHGLVLTDFVPSGPERGDAVYDMAIQPNGKIVAAGYSHGTNYDFALARYNLNGSLDTSFSGDGRLITNFVGSDVAYDVALQPDGKIIAMGNVCDNSGRCGLALARYKPGGGLDSTFSGDGKKITYLGGRLSTKGGLAIQADGKIVVAGRMLHGSDSNFVVLRYNPNGSLDTTFSADGWFSFGFGSGRQDYAYALDIQDSDGKIVVAGYSINPADNLGDFAIARLNPGGSLDTAFGRGGKRLTNFGGDDRAYGFGGQRDGRMVLVGAKIISNKSYFAIARYTPNGNLDATFNSTGKRVFSIITGTGSRAEQVIVQSDNKIVVMGFSSLDFALVRLDIGGGFDPTFSGDGKLTVDFGGPAQSYALSVQPLDGKYVLGGFASVSSQIDFALARVLP
jgi:uncharacterized delta-60 repeat protein